MDTTTKNLFKMIDAKKTIPRNNEKSQQAAHKKFSNHRVYPKSQFKIMKEVLETSEWKPTLPDNSNAFIPKGWRRATLRWIGFNLRRSQVDRAIIEKIIRQAANEVCLPPFSNKRTDGILKGIFKEPSIDMMEK